MYNLRQKVDNGTAQERLVTLYNTVSHVISSEFLNSELSYL